MGIFLGIFCRQKEKSRSLVLARAESKSIGTLSWVSTLPNYKLDKHSFFMNVLSLGYWVISMEVV